MVLLTGLRVSDVNGRAAGSRCCQGRRALSCRPPWGASALMVNWFRNRTIASFCWGRTRTCRARSSCRTPQYTTSRAHSCGRIVASIQFTTRLSSLSASGGILNAARIRAPSMVPLRPAQCFRAMVPAIASASALGDGAPCCVVYAVNSASGRSVTALCLIIATVLGAAASKFRLVDSVPPARPCGSPLRSMRSVDSTVVSPCRPSTHRVAA